MGLAILNYDSKTVDGCYKSRSCQELVIWHVSLRVRDTERLLRVKQRKTDLVFDWMIKERRHFCRPVRLVGVSGA